MQFAVLMNNFLIEKQYSVCIMANSWCTIPHQQLWSVSGWVH